MHHNFLILITTLLLSMCVSVQGRHIIGGDVTYECLGEDVQNPGNKRYRITMTIFRDCNCTNCAGFDSAPGEFTDATVTIFRGSDPTPFDVFALDAPVISQVDVNISNPCLIVPPNICVEQGVYIYEVSLPVSDSSYVFAYQRCCRNNTITNIIDPGDTGATFVGEISGLAQQECNNSPVFSTYPPTVICANELLVVDASATDADGDQLLYSLCAPLKGGSDQNLAPNPESPPPYDPVDFTVPTFSPTAPLGIGSGITIDAATGLLTGVPTIQGQFVVGICVSEFRNGQLISQIQRDFQFNVTVCEEAVTAALDAPLNDGVYEFLSCSETAFVFVNASTDDDFIDEYRWEFILGNGDTLISDLEDIEIDFPGPGTYMGLLTLNPGVPECTDSAFFTVTIVPEMTADFTFSYDTCVAGPVEFTDGSDTNGIQLVTWDWSFGDGGVTGEQSPIHQYQDPGQYTVQLDITDTYGCTATTAQTITWLPAPPVLIVAPDRAAGCPHLSVSFTNLSAPIDETYETIWTFGDGNTSGQISPSTTYQNSGLYDVTLSVTSPIGCQIDTTFPGLISVHPVPIADFSFSPQSGSSFEPEIQFSDLSSDDTRYWLWNFNGFDESSLQNPRFSFPDTGLMRVQLIVANEQLCTDTTVRTLDIAPRFTYFMPNAFSPNGDGLHDEFIGTGYLADGFLQFELRIWNRWGEQVFQSNSPNLGWNGRRNNAGDLLPSDVYSYIMTLTGPRGQGTALQGIVTLVR